MITICNRKGAISYRNSPFFSFKTRYYARDQYKSRIETGEVFGWKKAGLRLSVRPRYYCFSLFQLTPKQSEPIHSLGFEMPRPKTTTRIGGPIGRIERKTLNDRVYGELKDLIMTGAFKPGAELTLRTVAEALGTSFMPVRDAMRRLVTEHALEMRPSRTMAVPVLSWDEFHELYKVRTLLEGEAVALAAQKISQRQLEDIRGILEKLQNLKSKRADHFWTLNLKLHFSIYEIGASPLMLSIIKSLWLQIGPIMARVPVSRALQDSSDPHHLLVRALERRDPAAARAALDMDLTHASARILKDLAPKGVIAH